MTSRIRALAALTLATVVALALTSCGGDDGSGKDSASAAKTPDRSSFVPITEEGIAAIVDKHLGDRVKSYARFDDAPDPKAKQRSVEVVLADADRRDTFEVTVYAPGASQGQVVKGDCAEGEGDAQSDPSATVSCIPVEGGGNVTITHLAFGLASGNRVGSYLTASGTGPDDREATVAYESFTKKVPLSDKEIGDILGDPSLGWETDPETNKAGASLELAPAED